MRAPGGVFIDDSAPPCILEFDGVGVGILVGELDGTCSDPFWNARLPAEAAPAPTHMRTPSGVI